MELKQIFELIESKASQRYNWTLLELKLVEVKTYEPDFLVIIEPYWNWNPLWSLFNLWYYSYNWTLLELKFTFFPLKKGTLLVIIEPYWNWNHIDFVAPAKCCKVIIEPYWNWNGRVFVLNARHNRYNWTLLELKLQIGSSSDYANDVILEPHRILGVIDIREVIYLSNIYYAQPVYSQYSLSVLMSSQPGMPFLVMW